MRSRVLQSSLAALVLLKSAATAQVAPVRTATLPAFQSDSELSSYLQTTLKPQEGLAAPVSSCPGSASKSTAGKPVATTTGARAITIHGSVKDASGNALVGASVDIPRLGIATATSASGAYRLGIPGDTSAFAKPVTLRARRIAYEARQHTVKVSAGDSVRVDFALCATAVQLSEVAATSAGNAAITNVQHEGVDEGGIVKLHGDYLVILRRGRLFTVAIDDDELRPISTVNAYAPRIDPRGAWYDELLLHDDKVLVVGYSYQRGGTEIGVFRIDRHGGLRYVATYHLRSSDYYSSRNYASRLMGSKLVFYTPLYLWNRHADPLDALPSMRKWDPDGRDRGFRRIVTPQRVFRPAQPVSSPYVALHTVTSCDLATEELACEATVLVGPWGRVFYVSPTAVYVWTAEWSSRSAQQQNSAMLYRMPLDGSEPAALGVAGAPVDQFSFLESDDGHLNVVVRADAAGDAMWRAERTRGSTALLRAPLRNFGDGRQSAPWYWYRQLPAPLGATFHNRFVGDHLLYGSGNGWGDPNQRTSHLYVLRWTGGDVTHISLPHGTDRIEPMGPDAVIVGSDGRDLHFSGIRLQGRPRVAQRFTLDDAAQGELRSHGFFYTADGPTSGTLGLPVRYSGKRGHLHLVRNSASILFLRNDDERFDELGELRSVSESVGDDGCVASCVDWYGNARPLFIGRRVFALLGYELVEGRVSGGRMREARRVNYAAPRFMPVSR